MSLNESIVEAAALEVLGELRYAVGHGPLLLPRSRRRSPVGIGVDMQLFEIFE